MNFIRPDYYYYYEDMKLLDSYGLYNYLAKLNQD